MKKSSFYIPSGENFFQPRFRPFQINNSQKSFTTLVPCSTLPRVSAFVRYKQIKEDAKQSSQKTPRNAQQDRGTLVRKPSTGSEAQIKRTRSKSRESEVKRTKEPRDYPANLTRNPFKKILPSSQEDCSTSTTNHQNSSHIKNSNKCCTFYFLFTNLRSIFRKYQV